MFRFPHSKNIWSLYLSSFIKRYKGTMLERTRDLFEKVISEAPADSCKVFFLQYAAVEEKFGLTRRAMEIYERAAKKVPVAQRFAVYELYAQKGRQYFGISKMREVYEMAIEAQDQFCLECSDQKKMCLR